MFNTGRNLIWRSVGVIILCAAIFFTPVKRARAQTTGDSIAVLSSFAAQVALETAGLRAAVAGEFFGTAPGPRPADLPRRERTSRLIRQTFAGTGVPVLPLFDHDAPAAERASRIALVNGFDRRYSILKLEFTAGVASLYVSRFEQAEGKARGVGDRMAAVYTFRRDGGEWRSSGSRVETFTSVHPAPPSTH